MVIADAPEFSADNLRGARPAATRLQPYEGAEVLAHLLSRGHTFASISEAIGAPLASVHSLATRREASALLASKLRDLIQVKTEETVPDLASLEALYFGFGGGHAPEAEPLTAIDKARLTGWPFGGALAFAIAEELDGADGFESAVLIEAKGRKLAVQRSTMEFWWRKPSTLRFHRIFDILAGDHVVASLALFPTGYCEPHKLRHADVLCSDVQRCQRRDHLFSSAAFDPMCLACAAVRAAVPTMQLTVHGVGCQLGLLGCLSGIFLAEANDVVCTHFDLAVDIACDREALILEPSGGHHLSRVLSTELLRDRGREIAIYDKLATHLRKVAAWPSDSVLQPGTEQWQAITRVEARVKSARKGGLDCRLSECIALLTKLLVIGAWQIPERSFLLGRRRHRLPKSLRQAARDRALELGQRPDALRLAYVALCAARAVWNSSRPGGPPEAVEVGSAKKLPTRHRKRELHEELRLGPVFGDEDEG